MNFTNSIATSIPMPVADLITSLAQSGRAEINEFAAWWNQIVNPLFKTFVAAGVSPADALGFIGKIPAPRQLQSLKFTMVGTLSTVITQQENQQWAANLGFAGLPAIPVQIGGSISSSNQQSGTQQSQASCTLEVTVAPAIQVGPLLEAFVGSMNSLQAGLPPVPSFLAVPPLPAVAGKAP